MNDTETKSAELAALVDDAIEKQLQCNCAWLKLAEGYEAANGSWSAIVRCVQATNVSDEEIRLSTGAPPSTLARWKDGLVTPSAKLRSTLFKEMIALIPQNRAGVERRYRK